MQAHAAVPQLTGTLSRNVGTIAGKERSFFLYAPKVLAKFPPLVIVLSGGAADAATAREGTGYEFDLLADEQGFLVAYPEAYEHAWNYCQRNARNSATAARVDDVGFIEAIVAREVAYHGADPQHVFAVGHANGGQMVLRLALERPDEFAGVAVLSASLPAAANNACRPSDAPVPIMIVNGTADPFVPYRGASVVARNITPLTGPSLGKLNSGTLQVLEQSSVQRLSPEGTTRAYVAGVMAAPAMAEYWAKTDGHQAPPTVTRLPHKNPSDPTAVEETSWSTPGKPPVVLYSVIGGGHLVPQPYFQFPRSVGAQTEDLDAPAAIWEFFKFLPSRTPP